MVQEQKHSQPSAGAAGGREREARTVYPGCRLWDQSGTQLQRSSTDPLSQETVRVRHGLYMAGFLT